MASSERPAIQAKENQDGYWQLANGTRLRLRSDQRIRNCFKDSTDSEGFMEHFLERRARIQSQLGIGSEGGAPGQGVIRALRLGPKPSVRLKTRRCVLSRQARAVPVPTWDWERGGGPRAGGDPAYATVPKPPSPPENAEMCVFPAGSGAIPVSTWDWQGFTEGNDALGNRGRGGAGLHAPGIRVIHRRRVRVRGWPFGPPGRDFQSQLGTGRPLGEELRMQDARWS
jgi:hypothetical protein